MREGERDGILLAGRLAGGGCSLIWFLFLELVGVNETAAAAVPYSYPGTVEARLREACATMDDGVCCILAVVYSNTRSIFGTHALCLYSDPSPRNVSPRLLDSFIERCG